ncbi:nuclear receptor coactivator 6-like [Cydia amplana]|uniref:nuclear receptor coactivator 6-like n=1 Tax=Cydia amplana TaxID=1869771 RepID=UPI002FE6253E
MALDKQKILSDLGNVMNQLQSADCGCMGKLFNQGQGQGQRQCMPSQGYGGCCRRGYGHPCCGEPYSMGEGMPAHGRPCMSYCNAPKQYADGYNFLNRSVMQPVIKEVYDDLKSLNSGNTVTNNPLGAQMGLTPGVPTLPADGNMTSPQMANMNANSGGQSMARGHPMMQHMQDYQMSGVHQMTGDQMAGGQPMVSDQQMSGGQKMPGNTQGLANFNKMFPGITQGEGGGLSFNPMEIAMQMNPALAKQQPGMNAQSPMPGTGGEMNQSANVMQPGMNATNFAQGQAAEAAQSNLPNQAMPNQQHPNPAAGAQQPQQAYAAQNQLPPNFPPQGTNQNAHMGRMNANQGGQKGNYGQHTPGITKFKEMFPGVMAGDVDFDPMEIAIQMNPANKQAAAMSSMQKLMSAKPLDPNSAGMKPVMAGMNAVNANLASNQSAPGTQAQSQPDQATGQVPPEQQQYSGQPATHQQQYTTNQVPANQQQYFNNQVPPNQQYAANPASTNLPNQLQPPQQVYTAHTDNQGYQQVPQQEIQNYREIEPPEPMSQGYPNQAPGGRVYEREHILPVDNSRYNTLGQPIEPLPTKKYRMPETNLPQTLSPQKVSSRLRVNNNVKSTISKTSLYARQAGQITPSRAQLQQVYNQYKGSQSYTNQTIPNRDPRGQTISDGRLTGAPPVERSQIPVERVGGDTIANSQANNETVKGHVVGQVGDVSNKPAPGSSNVDLIPTKSGKLRNGLQDMVFTSYPQSTAWSFHGPRDLPLHRLRA